MQATGALTTGKQAKEKPKPGSKNVDDAALAGSPLDPDERLLFDAYNNAVAQADKIVSEMVLIKTIHTALVRL